jgi:hypothetical protein
MDLNDGATHYHIHWTGKPTLDWACFPTRAEAEKNARQLVLPGETYTIEEHDESCPQCMNLMKRMAARGTSNEVSA